MCNISRKGRDVQHEKGMNELCNIGRDYIHVVSSLRLTVGKFVNVMCNISRRGRDIQNKKERTNCIT